MSRGAMDVIEAAKAYVEAAEKATAELGAPDMSTEEAEAFLRLKDRVYLLENPKAPAFRYEDIID